MALKERTTLFVLSILFYLCSNASCGCSILINRLRFPQSPAVLSMAKISTSSYLMYQVPFTFFPTFAFPVAFFFVS
ncbi:uncharacterized protein BJ212DRAFT_1343076 [Suillus subaureus]|uniref:Uncharacterized protein n=1 Tax=Suillus subaureus TaxID=48587 RepID=A0A9P7JFX1_9AGAM|nr:uncharacterized protein BJ212DRAFT_1343076 [Suillus subaureus]KAG1819791.1 hypothetical protein BJ212DRAFT_1343076 [Suillus subaureus]